MKDFRGKIPKAMGDNSPVWGQRARSVAVNRSVVEHHNPPSFRVELAEILAQRVHPGSSVLEAGCFTGLTSALLAQTRKCTLLDLSADAVDMARQVFEQLDLDGDFIVGDLFAMPFDDGTFDVVFNSGVLEHFRTSERRAALLEMSRVTAPGGLVVAAVPNHRSFPYRLAYLLRRATKRWPYPPEKKIRSLRDELRSVGLASVETRAIASDMRFSQLAALPLVVGLCRWIERARGRPFAGYLEVAIGVRQGTGT
jgi:ubiquinone/menaquinone biosynthesis C-methylase UbiE